MSDKPMREKEVEEKLMTLRNQIEELRATVSLLDASLVSVTRPERPSPGVDPSDIDSTVPMVARLSADIDEIAGIRATVQGIIDSLEI